MKDSVLATLNTALSTPVRVIKFNGLYQTSLYNKDFHISITNTSVKESHKKQNMFYQIN